VADGLVLGSAREAQYLAELMFKQAQNALRGTVELAGSGEDPLNELPLMRPGSRITVTWDVDEADAEFNQRNFLVENVSLAANFGRPDRAGRTWDVSLGVREFLF
jgi:hypothetical protein